MATATVSALTEVEARTVPELTNPVVSIFAPLALMSAVLRVCAIVTLASVTVTTATPDAPASSTASEHPCGQYVQTSAPAVGVSTQAERLVASSPLRLTPVEQSCSAMHAVPSHWQTGAPVVVCTGPASHSPAPLVVICAHRAA